MKLVATKDEQIIHQTLLHNYPEFGTYLTFEQYLEREHMLSSTEFGSRLTCWVLMDGEKVVSACETYTRPCMANINNTIIRGNCLSLGSVVTPLQYRGKGYAKQMLRLIQQQQPQTTIASNLYSDIGPEFYHKLGWSFHPSYSLLLEAKEYQKQELVALDHLRSIIKVQIPTLDNNEFVIIPTFDAFEWLAKRSLFYARVFHNKELDYFGTRVNDDFLLWMYDFKESVLVITHYSVTNTSNATKLLQCACTISFEWGLKQVEVWDPCDLLKEVSGLIQGRIVERTDSLSSLCVFNTKVPLKWKWNEKYAWV